MEPDVVKEALPVTEGAPAAAAVAPVEPKPGEKTDPALLLKSLQEEREEKKRERDARIAAETKLAQLEAAQNPVVFSDEGKAILQVIEPVKAEVEKIRSDAELSVLYANNPVLVDKKVEFDEYRSDPQNKGMSLATAARAFIVEKYLTTPPPARKGLEGPSGGGRVPPATDGMTAQEADNLRTTNYREYSRLVRTGKLKIQS